MGWSVYHMADCMYWITKSPRTIAVIFQVYPAEISGIYKYGQLDSSEVERYKSFMRSNRSSLLVDKAV